MSKDNEIGARFRLAGPEIISETFDDGESIVVNLENGFYFSLNPAGGLAFELLSSGVRVDEIAVLLADRYEADATTIGAAVAEFALRLVEEGLICTDGASAPSAPNAAPAPAPVADGRAPFEAPALTTYTDMQDLLLADPIHDYDETGWPARIENR